MTACASLTLSVTGAYTLRVPRPWRRQRELDAGYHRSLVDGRTACRSKPRPLEEIAGEERDSRASRNAGLTT
jgi:hypothetical protein